MADDERAETQPIEQEIIVNRSNTRRHRREREPVDRANWAKRPKRVSRLLELLLEQKKKNKGTGSTFKPEAWTAITSAFNATKFIENGAEVQVTHNAEQFKTLITEKQEMWKRWSTLRHINSGFGWDNLLNRVSVSDDVWDSFVKGNPWAATYREATLPTDWDEWDQLFRGSVATGRQALGPLDVAASDDETEDEQAVDSFFPSDSQSEDPSYASSSSSSTPARVSSSATQWQLSSDTSHSTEPSERNKTPPRSAKLSTGQQLVRALERLVPDNRTDKSKVPQALTELEKSYAAELTDEEHNRIFLFLSKEDNARMFVQFITQKAAKSLTIMWLKRNSNMQT
jgi:hypothetical protein